MALSWVVIDFETASTCDLKRAGGWRYAEDITTEIICLAYSVMGEEAELWTPDSVETELRELAGNSQVTFIAHNVAFEKAIWRNIMVPVYGFPDIPDPRWHDTMAVCAMKVIPQKLEWAAKVLNLDQNKDLEGSRLVRQLSKPRKDGSYDRSSTTLEKVYAYCEQDIRTEVALHESVGWLSPGERSVWLLDQRINQRGVRLDLDYVEACQSIVQQASGPLAQEFEELTGGLRFSQRDKVIEWVRAAGVVIPDMKKETLAQMLGDEEDEDGHSEGLERGEADPLPPNVRRALSIRSLIGSASVKKLGRMEDCVCGDGRARGLLQYHGAGPGRWAGRILQPQNFPRGTISVSGEPIDPETVVESILSRDAEYVETICGPAVETVVGGLRHALVSEPDRVFVSGDFSTIEARIVLALAGQHDKLKIMSEGGDIYIDMAQQIYGRPLDKKKDKAERQTGKNSVLGLGFQMGAAKFEARYGQGQPAEFFEGVVDTYRKQWAPLVPALWYGLEGAAVKAVWDDEQRAFEAYGIIYQVEGRWLTARLRSGRKLWYYDPQRCYSDHPSFADKPAWTYGAWKYGHFQRVNAYGGLLTENVVQGLARDLLVAAMFRCEKEGLPIVLTVHDEIVVEPEAWAADETMLEQVMKESPPWAKEMGIPIAGEFWTGDRYKK